MFSLKKSVSFQIYLPICYCKYLSCRLSSSSRPIANFEPFIDDNVITSQNQQSQNNYVSVKHSGMLGNRSTVRLPDSLVEAAEKIAENRNDQNLNKIAKYLNDHLVFKKPPLTQSQIEELEANCTELIHSTHPLPDTSFLSVEDERRILNSQNSKIKRALNQKMYKWKPVVYNAGMSMTYLIARLAPDYASLYQAFSEICNRDKSFKPNTIFDFGSGLGTALWAAKSCWNVKTFSEAFCVDSSIDMNNLALGLIQGGVFPKTKESYFDSIEKGPSETTLKSSLKGLHYRQFMPTSNAIKYDLVVCGHTLLELPSAEVRLQTALSLWRKSQGYLVFVEHGSRAASEVLIEIRDFLITVSKDEREPNLEGHVFAPCVNETACPRLNDKTPCNFEVKYQDLFRKDRVSKERFSFLILKKGSRPNSDPQWPRVVRPVLTRSGHTVCRLCTKEGKLEEVVVSRSKHSSIAYKCARITKWGDLLPANLSHQDSIDNESLQQSGRNETTSD